MSTPSEAGSDGPRTFRVLVYASDPAVRARVRVSVGRRPDHELGRLDYVEADNGGAVTRLVDAGDIDLCVLDGEAWPTGGLGISRQLKNEIRDCPAMLVLVGRADDAWLGTWSEADAVLPHPLDPIAAGAAVVRLLRARAGLAPARADGG
ncbi:MAG: hypothetical protein M3Z02_08435 [Actinomycetota bacterium]|nr:hypothetical protein [Actinomycetota bacterium]